MSDIKPTVIETSISEPPPTTPTPLADFLRLLTPTLSMGNHYGFLTPSFFDAAEREAGTAFGAAAAMDLGWLVRLAVTGKDRARWLAGMTTNAIQTLSEGAGAYNFVLNAQGRIQGDLYAYKDQDRLLLETSADQLPRLTQHLQHYIIMDDVRLQPLDELTALGVAGPAAAGVLKKLGFDTAQFGPVELNPLQQKPWVWGDIPLFVVHSYGVLVPHFALWFPREHVARIWTALLENGCRPCGFDAAETLRIVEGIPAFGVDISDKQLAQETSQMRALNFSKGCYLGQEIVERIRSRANIHRALRAFVLEGPAPLAGAELRSGGKPVGTLTSVTSLTRQGKRQTYALGMVRLDALGAGSLLEYDGEPGTGQDAEHLMGAANSRVGTAISLDKPPDIAGA